MMDLGLPSEDELAFRPDHFFLAPTRGRGVVRDRLGRILDRCAIETEGRWDHTIGALQFDEVFSFRSGRVETLNWAFRPDPQGRMSASEASVTSGARGWREGADYRVRFRRAGPLPPLQSVQLLYDVRFTLLEPRTALKVTQLKLFGVTIAVMTGYHRRAGLSAYAPAAQAEKAAPA